MEVFLESEEQMGRNKQKGRGKRQRPAGPPARRHPHQPSWQTKPGVYWPSANANGSNV